MARPGHSSSGSNGSGYGVGRSLQQDFDLLLGLLQRSLAHPRQCHAALELLQGVFERKIAVLELFDRRLEFLERFLEVDRRGRRRSAGAVFASRVVSGARKPCTGVGIGQRAARMPRRQADGIAIADSANRSTDVLGLP